MGFTLHNPSFYLASFCKKADSEEEKCFQLHFDHQNGCQFCTPCHVPAFMIGAIPREGGGGWQEVLFSNVILFTYTTIWLNYLFLIFHFFS